MSSTRFKTFSDVHMQYTLLCKYISQNAVSQKDHSMTETRRLKNVVIFLQTIYKFCAIKKDNS